MATTGLNFAAEVDDWTRETEDRITRVFRQSAQEVRDEMLKTRKAGGRMRVDTGFLRASIRESTSEMPRIIPGAQPKEGAKYPAPPPISMVIAGAALGSTVYLGFTANYAIPREYGSRGQAPDAFVRGAALLWPRIVARVIARAKALAG